MSSSGKRARFTMAFLFAIVGLGLSNCAERTRLSQIETKLDKILQQTARVETPDFHLIAVNKSAAVSHDKVEVSKFAENEIVWIAKPADYKVRVAFDKPNEKTPFPELSCPGARYCYSGPIDGNAEEEKYYQYTVCVTPPQGKEVCRDPGVIIKP